MTSPNSFTIRAFYCARYPSAGLTFGGRFLRFTCQLGQEVIAFCRSAAASFHNCSATSGCWAFRRRKRCSLSSVSASASDGGRESSASGSLPSSSDAGRSGTAARSRLPSTGASGRGSTPGHSRAPHTGYRQLSTMDPDRLPPPESPSPSG